MYEIFCIKLAHDNTQCKYQTHSTFFFYIKVHDTTQNKPMYLMNLILKTESQTLWYLICILHNIHPGFKFLL